MKKINFLLVIIGIVTVCCEVNPAFAQSRQRVWFKNLKNQTGDSVRICLIPKLKPQIGYELAQKIGIQIKDTPEVIVLVNFPKGDGGWTKAVEWGKKNNLQLTDSQEILALAWMFPRRDSKSKFIFFKNLNSMIVGTTGHDYKIDSRKTSCCVYEGKKTVRVDYLSWGSYSAYGSMRDYWESYFSSNPNIWFAFRK